MPLVQAREKAEITLPGYLGLRILAEGRHKL